MSDHFPCQYCSNVNTNNYIACPAQEVFSLYLIFQNKGGSSQKYY